MVQLVAARRLLSDGNFGGKVPSSPSTREVPHDVAIPMLRRVDDNDPRAFPIFVRDALLRPGGDVVYDDNRRHQQQRHPRSDGFD